jgi:hypothetical protein
MPDTIQDALEYILDNTGTESCWCNECGEEIGDEADKEFVRCAKELAEWVKENCK